MDFSANEQLYRFTGYQVAVPADRAVFVPPVADERPARVMDASSPLPIEYLPDAGWERPVPAMLDTVVRKELTDSAVFANILRRATPSDCILKVSVVQFDVGIQELVAGRRSLGAVTLRARVYGPEVDGARPLWFDNQFTDHRASDGAMRPVSPRVLAGMALQASMLRMLSVLDQSNLARTNVPLEVK